nr:Gag-Pol polyprotein [Tanacetum cinerariifolium]
MSTQQDIYAAGSESRPLMLNKENYVLWSSRLLWYAKSKPNGKLIHNSILNGPYVRKQMMKGSDIGIQEKKTKLFNEWEREYCQQFEVSKQFVARMESTCYHRSSDQGFLDADYAGCKDTFKSTSGGAQFLGEKLVSWSSKKQDYTALSTAEEEYVALSA